MCTHTHVHIHLHIHPVLYCKCLVHTHVHSLHSLITSGELPLSYKLSRKGRTKYLYPSACAIKVAQELCVCLCVCVCVCVRVCVCVCVILSESGSLVTLWKRETEKGHLISVATELSKWLPRDIEQGRKCQRFDCIYISFYAKKILYCF